MLSFVFLGSDSYYPQVDSQVSDNRLFGMYHSHTAVHSKQVIMNSMQRADGVVRIVFATVALGMGVKPSGCEQRHSFMVLHL